MKSIHHLAVVLALVSGGAMAQTSPVAAGTPNPTVQADKAQLAADKATVTADRSTLQKDRAQVKADREKLRADRHHPKTKH